MGKSGNPTEWHKAHRASQVVLTELGHESLLIDAIVCGSVRRGVPVVSDVDIVLLARPEVTSLTVMRPARWNVNWTPKGGLAYVDDVRIEMYVAPNRMCLGATTLFVTGSGKLNVYMRRKAQRRGWKLSQYGLLDVDAAVRIDEPTGDFERDEMEIFHRLDMPFLEPEERSDGRWEEMLHRG